MSLLAGYDVVIELGNELVRDLIIANLRLSDAATALPFIVAIPLKAGLNDTIGGVFHLNVTAVEVDLQTTRPMVIKLLFEDALVETLARRSSVSAGDFLACVRGPRSSISDFSNRTLRYLSSQWRLEWRSNGSRSLPCAQER